MHKLLLMVTHAFMLEKGTLPHCHFNQQGGIIGASKTANWKINNFKNEISDIEFEIKYYDADYCLIAHTSNIFINKSSYALPIGGIIRLKDNDIISLFNYEIRAKIFTNQAEIVTLQDELSFLVNNPSDKMVIGEHNLKLEDFSLHTKTLQNTEKLLTLNQTELDPLLALKDSDITEDILNLGSSYMIDSDYKFFNPNINSSLEYYDPIELNILNKKDEASVNNLYNTPQDVFASLKPVTSIKSGDREEHDEEILDPLFFIK